MLKHPCQVTAFISSEAIKEAFRSTALETRIIGRSFTRAADSWQSQDTGLRAQFLPIAPPNSQPLRLSFSPRTVMLTTGTNGRKPPCLSGADLKTITNWWHERCE